MKRLMAVLLFLLLAASAIAGILHYAKKHEEMKQQEAHPVQKVVIYTDMQSGILEELNPLFYEETGIQFDISYVTTDQLLKKKVATDKPADVFLTSQDTLIRLKDNEALAAYSSSQTDTALALLRDEDSYWTGLWVDPIIFAVNQDFIAKHPAFAYTWDEVLNRQSVRLSMTDFIAADMAKDMLMCLAEHFGIEDTFRMLAKAQQHLVQYGKYLSTPSRMAAMGKCDVGISGFNEALRTKEEKMPVAIIYPEDGSPWYLYGIGLSADSPHPDRGEMLIDWFLTPEKYKAVMEKNHCYFMYVNDQGQAPDAAGNGLMLWDLEKKYFDEGKKDLLNQWGEKVRFGGTGS